MDTSKRHATANQVTALMEYMQVHSDVAKGLMSSGLEKEDIDSQWRDLTAMLNSMGGAVKSTEKWKQTWRDLKSNTKKRALLKQQQSLCDTSGMDNSQGSDPQNSDSDYLPPKKRFASFDEEILRIERDKLEVDRDYKVQKIEVLSRIAAALEELARKK